MVSPDRLLDMVNARTVPISKLLKKLGKRKLVGVRGAKNSGKV
ncbi:hypothetical protein TRICHSKD4_4360 [Roseibium sp. TrichSKD4]|nr:hypothetical protein TRICHSKD4_4360 [Roseibium sp. TrichSKD4]